MRFLSGKPLPRRTFLHSVGATVALPFLDAMMPALSARAIGSASVALTRSIRLARFSG